MDVAEAMGAYGYRGIERAIVEAAGPRRRTSRTARRASG